MTRRLGCVQTLAFAWAFAFALACSVPVHAENLGQHGQTYALDQDARESIKDVIRRKQMTGELDQYWQSYKGRTVDAIKHPKPLGIESSYSHRLELRALKYTFPADIRNQLGAVVVRRGTVVEPLKLQPLHSGLIFIDGRDQRQVDYAIARGRQLPLKIVLTAGSPFDLRVQYQNAPWWGGAKTIPFYFDQRRMIINTMARLYGVNIGSVPVSITQQGDQLAIEYGMDGGR